jgi:nucleotide-binding universal stress UspA family protein
MDPEAEVTAEESALGGVVVGFDGSDAADRALDWAAAAAQAHGLPLTLLAALPDAEGEILDVQDPEEQDLVDEDVAERLTAGIDRARATHPSLQVTGLVHPESPVESLIEASQTADLLVMGSRGMGGFAGLLLGSTTMNVAPYAHCPVVVLYEPDERTRTAVANARHPEEIIVGFDGSVYAERALRFALAHAAVTGLAVAVVVVSKGRSEDPPEQVDPADDDLGPAVRELLQRAAGLAEAHPGVVVTYLHGHGRPAGVLIEEAAGAALAVVGVRGRGGFAQLLLGSVGLQMLLHAECPVAVVREGHS